VSQAIEIESIARLDIKPGETLLVKLARPITREEAHQIKDTITKELPDGVIVLIVSSDFDFSVVSQSEQLRPAPTDIDWLEVESPSRISRLWRRKGRRS
jgi:hypothetical protein